MTIFAAILCPELLCPDRRDNVLSLYLSTAVGRLTYVVGKLIAAVVPLLCLTLAAGAAAVRRQHVLRRLGDGLPRRPLARRPPHHRASGLLLALYVSLVGLAVASFTSRRAFALGGYAALMLIPTFVGGSLVDGAELDKPLAADHARPPADRGGALALSAATGPGSRSPAGGGGRPAASS